MPSPTPLDLITVDDAIAWIFGADANTSAQNAGVLQTAISSLSLEVLRRTGRAQQNGAVPAQSPFNQPVSYTESYTGNNNELIQLRNWPIVSVQSVTVLGQVLPESQGPTFYGWYIHSSGKSLGIRLAPQFSGFSGYGYGGWQRGGTARRGGWPMVIDSIQVQYTAGFGPNVVTAELQTIPPQPPAWQANTLYGNGSTIFDGTSVRVAQILTGTSETATSGATTPPWSGSPQAGAIAPDGSGIGWQNAGLPFVLTVNNLPWLSDDGVDYFAGGELTPVMISPARGQYYLLGGGSYLFNSGDAGTQVLLSYDAAGTPADLQETMLRWVNLIYKRRGWEGLRSLMQKDGGSTIFTSFEIDPSFEKTFQFYRRRA